MQRKYVCMYEGRYVLCTPYSVERVVMYKHMCTVYSVLCTPYCVQRVVCMYGYMDAHLVTNGGYPQVGDANFAQAQARGGGSLPVSKEGRTKERNNLSLWPAAMGMAMLSWPHTYGTHFGQERQRIVSENCRRCFWSRSRCCSEPDGLR